MRWPGLFGVPRPRLDPMTMTTSRRIRVVALLCGLCLLLPGLVYGQKGGRRFRPPRGRSPAPARGAFYPKGFGNLGAPPRNPMGFGTLGPSFRPSYPKGGGKFGTAVKIITSLGAATAAWGTAQALEGYQQERAYLDGLHSRGLDQSDDCIYSTYFKVTGGGWSDLFSDPDLFFYVDIEGQGSFLVPQIHWNYAGGPILDRVLARDVKPGTRIVVRVLDDDTWSNEIWNNILKTRVTISVAPEVQVTKYISIRSGYVGGQIQLLEGNVVIDAPDPVATAEFVVPESEDGFWAADATLFDDSGNNAGNLGFTCVQRSGRRDWQEHRSAASGWLGSAAFWMVLGSCFLIWFVKEVFSKGKSEPAGTK